MANRAGKKNHTKKKHTHLYKPLQHVRTTPVPYTHWFLVMPTSVFLQTKCKRFTTQNPEQRHRASNISLSLSPQHVTHTTPPFFLKKQKHTPGKKNMYSIASITCLQSKGFMYIESSSQSEVYIGTQRENALLQLLNLTKKAFTCWFAGAKHRLIQMYHHSQQPSHSRTRKHLRAWINTTNKTVTFTLNKVTLTVHPGDVVLHTKQLKAPKGCVSALLSLISSPISFNTIDIMKKLLRTQVQPDQVQMYIPHRPTLGELDAICKTNREQCGNYTPIDTPIVTPIATPHTTPREPPREPPKPFFTNDFDVNPEESFDLFMHCYDNGCPIPPPPRDVHEAWADVDTPSQAVSTSFHTSSFRSRCEFDYVSITKVCGAPVTALLSHMDGCSPTEFTSYFRALTGGKNPGKHLFCNGEPRHGVLATLVGRAASSDVQYQRVNALLKTPCKLQPKRTAQQKKTIMRQLVRNKLVTPQYRHLVKPGDRETPRKMGGGSQIWTDLLMEAWKYTELTNTCMISNGKQPIIDLDAVLKLKGWKNLCKYIIYQRKIDACNRCYYGGNTYKFKTTNKKIRKKIIQLGRIA